MPAFISMLLLPPLLGVALIATIYRQARTDEARPVQAIVVLGAAQYNGRPTSVLRARLDHAHALWERGLAPVIVLTGGQQPGDVTTEAEAGRDYLVELGVPDTVLLLETRGRDTWESLRGVDVILDDRGLSRILLVSDGFHLLRSERMARDLGFEAYSSAAPDSPIRPNTGREFGFVVREAVALAAHVVGRLA
ncbi:MAG: YdcF family protein [Chloroflexota bacterium]|nr:YdcF family protein [Chloroflexota bacterium]